MADICFITTCMGRLAHLRQTIGLAARQARSSCIVVDYSCPEQCGDWVEQHYPEVKVLRVPNQQLFCVTRARNIGAQAADAPWLCFFDADVILDAQLAQRLLEMVRPGQFFVAHPWVRELAGTVVCSRTDFERVGGYDEVIQGWGSE